MPCIETQQRGRVARGARRIRAAKWVLAFAMALVACSEIRLAGPQPDGSAVTPNGWRITPAGSQVDIGAGPLGHRA